MTYLVFACGLSAGIILDLFLLRISPRPTIPHLADV